MNGERQSAVNRRLHRAASSESATFCFLAVSARRHVWPCISCQPAQEVTGWSDLQHGGILPDKRSRSGRDLHVWGKLNSCLFTRKSVCYIWTQPPPGPASSPRFYIYFALWVVFLFSVSEFLLQTTRVALLVFHFGLSPICRNHLIQTDYPWKCPVCWSREAFFPVALWYMCTFMNKFSCSTDINNIIDFLGGLWLLLQAAARPERLLENAKACQAGERYIWVVKRFMKSGRAVCIHRPRNQMYLLNILVTALHQYHITCSLCCLSITSAVVQYVGLYYLWVNVASLPICHRGTGVWMGGGSRSHMETSCRRGRGLDGFSESSCSEDDCVVLFPPVNWKLHFCVALTFKKH